MLVLVALLFQRKSRVATAAAPPAPAVAGLVDGYAVNPGLQVRVAAKAFDVLKDTQECLLSQIPRLFRVLRQTVEQGVNFA